MKTLIQPNAKTAFQAPKGMHDRLPADEAYWEKITDVAKAIARAYGFGRIEPPVLEEAALYEKTSGEGSDVVSKEMYTLRTKGGDLLALRPEYTPGIARAYIEHGLSKLAQPQKFFAVGPVFRHDRPQLGRYRSFTQVSFETVGGVGDPLYDAEIITASMELLAGLKLKNPVVRVNSIGCRTCRPNYKKQLVGYYKNHEKELCDDCTVRLKANPMRLLDCKEEKCVALREKAPSILDKLCASCSGHFKEVLEYLDEVAVPYELDEHLVRGLDYYNRTVFEAYVPGTEAEIGALFAGGRYDYLMEMIGGHAAPAIGSAAGAERIIATMKAQEVMVTPKPVRKVFLAHAGELATKKAFGLLKELRSRGIFVVESLAKDSLKAQLKAADKEGIEFALILGQREIYEKNVIIRDLKNGLQEAVPLEKLPDELKKRMK